MSWQPIPMRSGTTSISERKLQKCSVASRIVSNTDSP